MSEIVLASVRDNRKKLTTKVMSDFEYSALIAMRAEHIEDGVGPQVTLDENFVDPMVVAYYEIHSLKPGDDYYLCVQRKLPDGRSEVWQISDMVIRG